MRKFRRTDAILRWQLRKRPCKIGSPHMYRFLPLWQNACRNKWKSSFACWVFWAPYKCSAQWVWGLKGESHADPLFTGLNISCQSTAVQVKIQKKLGLLRWRLMEKTCKAGPSHVSCWCHFGQNAVCYSMKRCACGVCFGLGYMTTT